MLTLSEIENNLHAPYEIRVFDEITSTNTVLKALAFDGARDGLVLIADSQTGGKGRLGRSFFSPPGTGLYISVLLRPTDLSPQDALRYTTMAAVAACRAIEEIRPSDSPEGSPRIKWVNDIYIRGRKCVGILTESSIDPASGKLAYAVMGIGFNVYEPEGGFPSEIKDIAGAVFARQETDPADDRRNSLASAFLDHYYELTHSADSKSYVEEYRDKCFCIGKDVDIITPMTGAKRTAHVDGITDDCSLLVTFDDGTSGTVSTGEISIRIH